MFSDFEEQPNAAAFDVGRLREVENHARPVDRDDREYVGANRVGVGEIDLSPHMNHGSGVAPFDADRGDVHVAALGDTISASSTTLSEIRPTSNQTHLPPLSRSSTPQSFEN